MANIKLPIEVSDDGSFNTLTERAIIDFESCYELPFIQNHKEFDLKKLLNVASVDKDSNNINRDVTQETNQIVTQDTNQIVTQDTNQFVTQDTNQNKKKITENENIYYVIKKELSQNPILNFSFKNKKQLQKSAKSKRTKTKYTAKLNIS
jgi:hypothetical protein